MVRAYNHICAAEKCYNGRITHPNKSFFGFPSDHQLCETWLNNCGRKDLSRQGVLKANGYYKLCSDHFEERFFTDSTKTLLKRALNPVPTIFVNNINTLLPTETQASTSDIDLPDLSDIEDASLFCETLLNPYELMVESNCMPISYRSKSLCTRKDYDAETISHALLNLEPETELHQIDNLCRFCMNKASKDNLDLFAEKTEAREIREISDVIMPNKLEICDGLPHKVCQTCVSDLRTCYKLMEQFRHADQYLRAIAKYSLYIESEDDVSPVWEEKADSFKEFVKPLPRKATVMPLKHFRPVVEGFQGYLEDVATTNTSNSADLNPCTNGWNKKSDVSFDDIEPDIQPIIIRSSDNDNSVSHILKNFPLQTTEMDPDLWESDIDLICNNVVIMPEKKLRDPMDTEQSINESQLVSTSLGAKEDFNEPLNSHIIENYLCPDEYKSQKDFSTGETETVSEKLSCNPIKEINFEINLMTVKSLENQPGLTVSYKCLQCSDLFPSYSDLVNHVISVHQIKPLPSPFTCEECAMQFDTATALMQHIKEQHITKSIHCNLCPNKVEFKSKAQLSRHKVEIHSLKCEKCGRPYYNQKDLDRHMAFKHDNRLVCNVCNKVLSSVQGRKMHELIHTERSEMCWVCGLVVKNSYVLKQHMQGHSDETYSCDKCDKVFPSQLYLRRHKKTHLPKGKERGFICHICPKRFYRKTVLEKHLLAHSEGRLFMCHYCGKCFKSNENLDFHETTREASGGICPDIKNLSYLSKRAIEKYKCTKGTRGLLECDVCGRKFMKVNNATRHRRYHFCQGDPEIIQKLLDEPEEYKCERCSKRFYTKHSLQFHVAANHTGVTKPFSCDLCPRKFRTRSQILIHEQVHSEERRYSCPDCDKKFKTKTHLLHHKSVHVEEKTHICSLCDAAFKSRSCLLEHTFYHKKGAESVRPFQCLLCGNRFVSESILKAHITKNHSADSLLENEINQAQSGGYPCSVCGKILVSVIACKKHIRRMHKNMSDVKVSDTEEAIATKNIVTDGCKMGAENLEETVEDGEESLEDIEETVGDLQETVEELDETVEDLEKTVEDLEETVVDREESTEETVGDLLEIVQELEVTVEETVDDHEESMEDREESMEDIEEEDLQEELEETIDDQEESMEDIEETLEDQEESMEDMEETVEDLQEIVELEEIVEGPVEFLVDTVEYIEETIEDPEERWKI